MDEQKPAKITGKNILLLMRITQAIPLFCRILESDVALEDRKCLHYGTPDPLKGHGEILHLFRRKHQHNYLYF
jgi:hypothetical protein